MSPRSEPDSLSRRRIRVAFSIDNMQVGGTELNAVRTAERLDPSRFELCVVSLQGEGPLMARYAARGIPVYPFPIGSLYGREALRQGVRLASFLRRHRIDVLHAHDIYSNAFSVPWARLAGARTIASRRWWEPLPGAAWRVLSRVGYRMAHVTLANSQRVGALVERTEGVPAGRVAVIPNFVDEPSFVAPGAGEARALRESLGLPEGEPVVGVVANLHPVKDHASLLRAVALLRPRWPGLRVVLVGDGQQRAALQALARELGIEERVVLAGRRPNQPNLHHLFDVSVLCSLSEGLSNSILEAMAAGRPVVATDVGASADAVLHGETGLLVPPASPEALADALAALLAHPARARALGEAGQRRARSEYSAASALSALEGLYTRLVGAAPLPRAGRAAADPHPLAQS